MSRTPQSPCTRSLLQSPRASSMASQAGFTLVELVMVMLVVSVLAVIALPRMFDLTMWRLRAFADDMHSATAAMQRRALAQHRSIMVRFGTGGVRFDYVPALAAQPNPPLPCPTAVPACLTQSSVGSVVFNPPDSGHAVVVPAPLRIGVTDGATVLYRFQLEDDTGLMWRLP